MKKITKNLSCILAVFTSLLFISAGKISADYNVAEQSAQLNIKPEIKSDPREIILRNYLKNKNSPLADYTDDFIQAADEYNIDWRLIPAITGLESSFGKRIPINSHNAYGWANGTYYFDSWEKSIYTVAKTLREKYIDRGVISINQIGRVYAPPSSTWSSKVKYFMKDISLVPFVYNL